MKEKILAIIEKNSKISIEDLAVLLGESVDQVANAVMEMEKDKVICGYHTIINWNKITSEKVNALIEVKVTPQRQLGFDKLAERIYNYPEVTAVYLMSGGFDFAVFIEGKTLQEIAEFVTSRLSTIEGVLSTATHFVLKTYKEHGTVLVEEPTRERQLITA
ncbi:MAG TPA: Lrp/AsnC family transcriptional regulator [Candidatus Scybalocola faecipullorum]|nr:Lrp/AsnC family transcriptional regulator [Candidatus Scybalocola faecipullorum]